MKIRKISDKELFIRALIGLGIITIFFFIGGANAVYAIGSGLAIGWTIRFVGRF